jgi:hypothetical protein
MGYRPIATRAAEEDTDKSSLNEISGFHSGEYEDDFFRVV